MTFARKFSGDRERPLVAEYTCPEHGVFACEVKRDENGEAPDAVACPVALEFGADIEYDECGERSTWTPSRISCRVKKWEAVRGKYEKPERKTYLDTRELGEGQDLEEFKAKRRAIWDEKRRREIKEMI